MNELQAGLGDVVATSVAAKAFMAAYAPLAAVTFARTVGTLALRPLEAARRAARRSVLEKYSSPDGLDAQTFDEAS